MPVVRYWLSHWWCKLTGHAGSCVAVYPLHSYVNVIGVIKQLQAVNFSVEQLSIIGQDTSVDQKLTNAHRIFGQHRLKIKQKDFWFELRDLLDGELLLQLPELGSLRIAGALSSIPLVEKPEQITVDDYSKLRKLLYLVGIPENSFKYYKSVLKNGKLVLIAVGEYGEIENAVNLIEQSHKTDVSLHFLNTS